MFTTIIIAALVACVTTLLFRRGPRGIDGRRGPDGPPGPAGLTGKPGKNANEV